MGLNRALDGGLVGRVGWEALGFRVGCLDGEVGLDGGRGNLNELKGCLGF